jgi:EF-P beta-lysylation protein EpmB
MISAARPSWQTELQRAIRDPARLLQALCLPSQGNHCAKSAADYRLRVTQAFVSRIAKGDPADPLLRQVLPTAAEQRSQRGYGADPVGDLAATKRPGVIHKYAGRVLLVASGVCAIHCRYCFRRQFDYGDSCAANDNWHAALNYIRGQHSVSEVILSGGDPLTLSNGRLNDLIEQLGAIGHVRRLRIHTRMPVVLPQRVDDGLLEPLAATALSPVLVVHANHANEIDGFVRSALQRLHQAGVRLLSQSVLLRGVNDDVKPLSTLSETLFDAGVLPYYLHLLDRVQGAAHFYVGPRRARKLHRALKAEMPGYLVPRLVQERPGAPYKVAL